MKKTKYIILRGSAVGWKDAILHCAQALERAGMVGPDFGKNCIEREEEYPTGLPTAVPVAIPHCRDETVTENAVCVLIPDSPVSFHRMDEEEETIPVEIIFTLALNDPDGHIDMLRNLAGLFKSKEKMEDFKKKSNEEMMRYLEKYIG